MGFTSIAQYLKRAIYDALTGANNPSSANVFATINDIKNLPVVLTTTNSSHTGNTNETALYISSLIPGGTITIGDLQEIETQVSKLNTASSVTINVYTNDTPDLVNSGGSLRNVRRFNLSASHLSVTDKHTYKMSSASAGVANISPIGDLTSYSDSGSQTTRTIGARTSVFDFANPKYVIVTATLIDTSDTVTLEFFQLFIKRP